MIPQSPAQDGRLSASPQSPEDLLGFQHAGGGPTQRHLGRAPALDVAADQPDRADGVLDDVGAGERAPEFVRQAETDDGGRA